MSIDARVEKLERSNIGVLESLSRIEFSLAEIKMELKTKATKEDMWRIEGEMKTKASAVELAEVKGALKEKPSTWTMMMVIMASQFTLVGIIFAIIRFGLK
jgi:hypothetical protein